MNDETRPNQSEIDAMWKTVSGKLERTATSVSWVARTLKACGVELATLIVCSTVLAFIAWLATHPNLNDIAQLTLLVFGVLDFAFGVVVLAVYGVAHAAQRNTVRDSSTDTQAGSGSCGPAEGDAEGDAG